MLSFFKSLAIAIVGIIVTIWVLAVGGKIIFAVLKIIFGLIVGLIAFIWSIVPLILLFGFIAYLVKAKNKTDKE